MSDGDPQAYTQTMTATIEVVVVRKDGTIETYEADITDLDEDAIRRLIEESATDGDSSPENA